MMGKIIEYPQEHYDFIKNNYQNMSQLELGRRLGVSHDVIRNHLKKLGLVRINKNPLPKNAMVGVKRDLFNYLHKKKKDFGVNNLDITVRKIVNEWIAFKKMEHERKSATDNNINSQAHE
jgi:predicted ArsR family transcriptional regulator